VKGSFRRKDEEMVVETRDHLSKEKIALFRTVCREQGIKVTPQRLEIFLEIVRARDHPSAEDVYTRVKTRLPTISLDTVYRTLATFERCGLVAKVQFLEDRLRFDPNLETHHHLFCSECKSILDFSWPDFDEAALPREVNEWGRPKTRHVHIRGICAACSAKRDRK
jgi:Fur family peroxide stress response transcriptional regulator